MNNSTLLIVDDEPNIRHQLKRWLETDGYAIMETGDGESALEIVRRHNVGIVLLDRVLPGLDGFAVLKQLNIDYPDCCVIMFTAFGDAEMPERALAHGAADFINKPFDYETLVLRIKKAYKTFQQHREINYRKEEERQRCGLEKIIGKSEGMQRVCSAICKVADTETNVLILGETGTGKELVARALHYNSLRANNVLVVADCGAMPESLIDSDLFGHERGAFTGAVQRRIGKFERANHGTLFIDEIGEFNQALQTKLLRVLEARQFERVGGSQPISVDVNIIAATNVDLLQAIQEKKFRQDLYYRLSVFTIRIPPLRERLDDVPLLVDEFIRRHGHKGGKNIEGIEDDALRILRQYHYPGNIRELENIIQRAIVYTGGSIIKKDAIVLETALGEKLPPQNFYARSLREAKTNFEREYLQYQLEENGWNISHAAAAAGIDRKNFRDKMKQYGIFRGENHKRL